MQIRFILPAKEYLNGIKGGKFNQKKSTMTSFIIFISFLITVVFFAFKSAKAGKAINDAFTVKAFFIDNGFKHLIEWGCIMYIVWYKNLFHLKQSGAVNITCMFIAVIIAVSVLGYFLERLERLISPGTPVSVTDIIWGDIGAIVGLVIAIIYPYQILFWLAVTIAVFLPVLEVIKYIIHKNQKP